MHTTQDKKALISQHIDTLQCTDDIIPLLESLFDGYDIAPIRAIFKEQINKINEATISDTFYKHLPVDPILPLDVIQECLSFVPFNDINLVSKQFKELDTKNQAANERARLIAVNQQKFGPNIPFDNESNKKWIVRKLGALSSSEAEAGYILASSLDFALAHCSSGDILQMSGSHSCTRSRIQHKKVSIIGVGDVKIHFGASLGIDDASLFLKNIELQSNMRIADGSVWIEKCRLVKPIKFNKGALHIRDCVVNKRASIHIFGKSSVRREVSVVNCLFQNECDDEEPCIWIRSQQAWKPADLRSVSLKCIGNIFHNKATYPIMDEDAEASVLNLKQTVIANNILKGRNIVDDADKIYCCDEEDAEEW